MRTRERNRLTEKIQDAIVDRLAPTGDPDENLMFTRFVIESLLIARPNLTSREILKILKESFFNVI